MHRAYLLILLILSQEALATKALNVTYSTSIEPIAINVMHEWVLTIQSIDGNPITHADIVVEGGMPEHNHGLPTAPKVTKNLGNGRYLLQGIRFHMSGFWQMKITVKIEGDEHVVMFPLDL